MPVEVTVPALGESIVEATVGRWLKTEGEPVNAGEPLVELETDKVNVEVPSPAAGVLASIRAQAGETVTVGAVLAVVAEGAAAPAPAPAAAPAQPSPPPAVPAPTPTPAAQEGPAADDGLPPTTPYIRRLAAEHGIDLRTVKGSGPRGRITREDVEAAIAAQGRRAAAASAPAPAPAPPSPPPAPAATPLADRRREERVRMSRRRLTIARRLVEAQHTAAMLTTFNEVDMSAVIALRKERREAFKERYGVSLGFMSFFTKAVVGALKAFPRLNAEIQGDEMVIKHYYDIGIAVATNEGLVVPVVRDADRLTFAEIEREIARLAERARKGELTLEELQGGTFTITNGGVFGSLFSTPILNTPQVGILGMHKVQERPVVVDGTIQVRPMMYVALSYDHRIVDGAEAVSFLVTVKELLEDPTRLLLEA
jgi:2-oxoglutarate dehydrogenase E2 component (dihydrolipoamide succinyltransferase)